MLLVSAVSLACMRTMTSHRSAAYLQYMTQYIQDFLLLHVDFNLRPNMHMAMHIPHFLHLFGPVRSWWCFPLSGLLVKSKGYSVTINLVFFPLYVVISNEI